VPSPLDEESALGHKWTHLWTAALFASRRQADVLNSLFRAMLPCPFARSSQYFPRQISESKMEKRNAFALASQHSHLVARFSALSRALQKAQEEARNCSTNWRSFCF
jgi:hypothetical protein